MRASRRIVLGCALFSGPCVPIVWAQAAPVPLLVRCAPSPDESFLEVSQPIDSAPDRPRVQIALLLDTSGSMDGLLEQAKTQLWSIVNELARADRAGLAPMLEVALYEYGKSSIPLEENQLRQILPLTSDLDEVSRQLFSLTTNGGEEFCGAAIASATSGLAWNDGRDVLKMIVIAGNEPFTQGSIDYRQSVPEAISRGIIVNTIHCGDRETGVSSGWADGARLGDGEYSFIDHNAVVAPIPAPQDEEIIRLGAELNTTYIAFGQEGQRGLLRQAEADTLAAGAGAAPERVSAKASVLYTNARWDLVDAVRERAVDLENVRDEDLPKELQGLTADDRKAFVEANQRKREEIQGRIAELSRAREDFVAEQRAKDASGETLQSALVRAIRAQAQRVGLTLSEQSSKKTDD